MMRKLLATTAAIVVSAGITVGIVNAVNLPLFSGASISEPSQFVAGINALVNAINFGTSGNIQYVPGPISSLATTVQQNFATITVNTGQLTAAGQGLLARCSGTRANTTVSSTIDIIMIANGQTQGSISTTAPIISTSALSIGNQNWDVDLLYQVNTTPVTANAAWIGRAFVGTNTGVNQGITGSTTPVFINVGNDTNNADNNINNGLQFICQYVMGAASGGGAATMESFTVQQVK